MRSLFISNPSSTTVFLLYFNNKKGSVVLSDQYLEVQNFQLNGTPNQQSQVTITLTNFKNPISTCELSFVCKNPANSYTYTSTYSPTQAQIPCIFLNIIILFFIAISIIPDISSSVAGYFPITVSFNLPTRFPAAGIILIPNVLLHPNVATDCASIVLQKSPFNNIQCEYTVSGNIGIIKITVLSFTGGITELSNTDTISLKLDKIQYNTKMSAKELSIMLLDSSQCNIAIGKNTDLWVPSNPAAFKKFIPAYDASSDKTVCSKNALLSIAIDPLVQVTTSQKVIIEFIGLSYNLPNTVSVSGLNGIEITGSKIKGTPAYAWPFEISLFISFFPLPSTEKPYQIKLTTYAGQLELPSEIVHSQLSSVSLSATKATLTNSGKIRILANQNTVSEIGTHQFTIYPLCGLTIQAKFKITLPVVYDATTGCKQIGTNCVIDPTNSNKFTLQNTVLSDVQAGDSLNIQYKTTNPPTTEPVTQKIELIAFDQGDYAAFILNTELDTDQYYLPGKLTFNSASNQDKTAAKNTIYTLSFTTNHKILSYSSIYISLPQYVITNSASLNSISIDSTPISSATSVSGSLIISNVFSTDLIGAKLIQIQLENIKNPSAIGTYTGFTVSVKSSNNFIIDQITDNSQSVIVSTAGTMLVTCSISDKTNNANSVYTFTLKQQYANDPFPLITGFDQYLLIQIPVQISSCQMNTLNPVTAGISVSYISDTTDGFKRIKLDYSSNTPEIAFKINCINPQTTQTTDPFILSLVLKQASGTQTESEALRGSVTITTEIGSLLQVASKINNSPKYPGYTSTSSLEISRSLSAPLISKIVLTVPNLPSLVMSPACTITGFTAYTCEIQSNQIILLFSSGSWNTERLQISGLRSVNPQFAYSSVTPVSVQTFYKSDTSFYIVDGTTNAGEITVLCNFPCKECLAGQPYKCTSCVDNISGSVYFLNLDLNTCKLDSTDVCGSGYLKNTKTNTCDRCDDSCKECSDSTSICTSCKDINMFLLNGKCISDCGTGYYKPLNLNECKQCDKTCSTCENTATNCKTCITNYYFYQGACVPLCPDQTFANVKTGYCENCDTTKCYKCSGSATQCTACINSFLKGTTCILENECIQDGTYAADSSKNLCLPCDGTCATCKDSPTKCTNCKDARSLYFNQCLSTCPTGYFARDSICQKCSDPCASCVGSETSCSSCKEGLFFDTDKKTCVIRCGSNFYVSGNECIKCDSSCLTCSASPYACTSCGANMLLYNSNCITQCPDSTFQQGTKCEACSPVCATCSGSYDRCLKCAFNKILDGSSCVSECSEGKMNVNGLCTECTGKCKTCEGEAGFCTSCKNPLEFVYEGKCVATCPTGTFLNQTTDANSTDTKSCKPCKTNCESCTLLNSTYERCIKCKPTFLMLADNCIDKCPENYTNNSDHTLCLKIGEPDPIIKPTNVTESKADIKNENFIVYPTVILFILTLIIGIGGWALNEKSLFLTNLLALFAALLFIVICAQSIISILDEEFVIFGITLFSTICTIAINILFMVPHFNRLANDQGYIKWSEMNICTNRLILLFSYIFNFQIRRLYYSRLLGVNNLFVRFQDIKNLLEPLSTFSMFFMLFGILPICVIDVYGFSKIDYQENLMTTLIASFILSLLVTLLMVYEAKFVKTLPADLFEVEPEDYLTVGETPDKTKIDPEELQNSILKKVLTIINRRQQNEEKGGLLNPDKKPVRIESEPDLQTDENNEKDTRKISSFPVTPRFAAKANDFFNEEFPILEELPDNVYHDEITENPNTLLEKQEKTAQTIPMKKLEEFKNKMLGKPNPDDTQVTKKLFDFDTNPLEMSEVGSKIMPKNANESSTAELNPKDIKDSKTDINLTTTNELNNDPFKKFNDNSLKLTIDPQGRKMISRQRIGVLSQKDLLGKTFVEKLDTPKIFDTSDGFQFSVRRVDKTIADPENMIKNDPKEQKNTDLSENTPSKLLEKMIDKSVEKSVEKLIEEKTPHKNEILNTDIFGSFDKDEQNAILIRQTQDGKYLDKKDRIVNNFGYLIDDNENIINRKGELILKKEDFIKEINQTTKDGDEKEVLEVISVCKEQSKKPEKNIIRDSAKEDPLMEDSPSKYNAINIKQDPMESYRNSPELNLDEKQSKIWHKNAKRISVMRWKPNENSERVKTPGISLHNNYTNSGNSLNPTIKSPDFNKTYYQPQIRATSSAGQKRQFLQTPQHDILNIEDSDSDEESHKNEKLFVRRLRRGSKSVMRRKNPKLFTNIREILSHKRKQTPSNKSISELIDSHANLPEVIEDNFAEIKDKVGKAKFPKFNFDDLLGEKPTKARKKHMFSGNKKLYEPTNP